MAVEEDFLTWLNTNNEYLLGVESLLKESCPIDDGTRAKLHLKQILGHRATLVSILARAHKFLTLATLANLPSKIKGGTEMERKILLEAEIADYTYWKEVIDGFIKTIDKQVSSSQTILSYEKNALTQLAE